MVVLLGFELASDAWARVLAGSRSTASMMGPIILVLCGNVAWQRMLRAGLDLSRGGILFSLGVAIGAVLIGVLCFQEAVTVRHGWGLAIGAVAIALLAT